MTKHVMRYGLAAMALMLCIAAAPRQREDGWVTILDAKSFKDKLQSNGVTLAAQVPYDLSQLIADPAVATNVVSKLKAAGVTTPVNVTLWWTPTHYGDASADEYARAVIAADMQEKGDEDVFRKVRSDLPAAISDAVIRGKMDELLVAAHEQITTDKK